MPAIIKIGDKDLEGYQISCRRRGAIHDEPQCPIGPYTIRWGEDSLKRAIEAWNNRPNSWHTEPPTEEGEYVVLCQYRQDDGKLRIYKTVFEFKNGEWTNLPVLENHLDEYKLIAWYGQKIEPYKEKS